MLPVDKAFFHLNFPWNSVLQGLSHTTKVNKTQKSLEKHPLGALLVNVLAPSFPSFPKPLLKPAPASLHAPSAFPFSRNKSGCLLNSFVLLAAFPA